MRSFIEGIIETGRFKLSDMETRIKRLFVTGDLTEQDMTELLAAAAEHAQDAEQLDVAAKLADLEHRVKALEDAAQPEPQFVIWTPGYVTRRGETVQYDVDGDGVLDLVRYDGGRDYTALSPGKINGWNVVDAAGNVLRALS